ncbi:MAG: hypothetical protein GX115_10250 [Ruminiclostridium sp.]|nr:hypothetical protein [Ruminiclostridium sp.]
MFASCKKNERISEVPQDKNTIIEQKTDPTDVPNSKENTVENPETSILGSKPAENNLPGDSPNSHDKQDITGIPATPIPTSKPIKNELPDDAKPTSSPNSLDKQGITGIPAKPTPTSKLENNDLPGDAKPTPAPNSPDKQDITGIPASPTPEIEPTITGTPSSSILEKKLEKKLFSLMDDRLFIQMPEGAMDMAIQENIMSAARSNQSETMLVLEEANERLMVYAQELFMYAGENFHDDVEQLCKNRYKQDVLYQLEDILQSGNELKVIKVTPDKYAMSSDMVEIGQAYIKTEDNVLIYIGVYVMADMMNETEQAIKQADRILGSIQPGTRTLNTTPHEETIWDNITLHLDKDFVLVEENGIHFTVYYLAKITKMNEDIPSIGIYIGAHPSLLYYGRGIESSQLAAVKDNILDKDVEWVTYMPFEDDDYYCAETVVPLSDGVFVIHIFIDAANEEEFATYQKMIHTMKYSQ